jgi:multiple sugar transport system permease protein
MASAPAAAVIPTPAGRRARPGFAIRDRHLKYLLVLPAMTVVGLTAGWPLLYSLALSTRVWFLSRSPRPGAFVGLANYGQAFRADEFASAAGTTALFVVLSVTLTTVLALGLALLLARGGPLRRFVQTILILPFAMSPALVGVSWRFLFNPEFGLFAALFGRIFPPLAGVNWLATPGLAFAALIMADVWAWTPFMTLILVGGLASLPRETVEAAQMDGSPAWRILGGIIIPQLKPVLTVVVILKTIFALKTFDVIFMLTQGGPGRATQTVVYYAYLTGFKYYNMGFAAAISWLMVVPMSVLTLLYIRFVFQRRA